MEEKIICPYCGNETANKLKCCGESSTHFITIYTVEYEGDIYEFQTSDEAEQFSQDKGATYEPNKNN